VLCKLNKIVSYMLSETKCCILQWRQMTEAVAALINIIFIFFPNSHSKFDDSNLKYPI